MSDRLSFFVSLIIILTQATACTQTSTGTPTATPIPPELPVALISLDRIFSALEDLTSIQPYSGWRNSATEGEAEALDYMADTLGDLAYLQNGGLELERQSFRVFLATEIWESRLYVTIDGTETEVPANASRGHRNDIAQALRFDSDGLLNDTGHNPATVEGQIVLIHSASNLTVLQESGMEGRIVFLDYALIDPEITAGGEGTRIITDLYDGNIAGLVLVTQNSNLPGQSTGKYLGDGFVLEKVTTEQVPVTLYVRLEDMAGAGISDWDDLSWIESARLLLDSDVLSPGTSGNLVARIPGTDSSKAIILGAHIDSANSPGAMDNGINSVVLLEVARILNEARIQPAVDLYLVWFGSEELWLYGSQYFVNTHQELLDRTIAACLMDSIIDSLPGPTFTLDGWSFSRFGDPGLAFPGYLVEKAAERGIIIAEVDDYQGIMSDNGVFSGFVPQVGFAFGNQQGDYAHSLYDTLDVVQVPGEQVGQITTLALIAALETGLDFPSLRLTPPPGQRALIIASHTEVPQMTATTLVDLDRALAWEGYDVDVIPYGTAFTAQDLESAAIVIVLPLIDFSAGDGDDAVYDESWDESGIQALLDYVQQGGLLVLTNSAHRIQLFGQVYEVNEDWGDVNDLAENFGVRFEDGALYSSTAFPAGEHPLTADLSFLGMIGNNAVPFTMQNGVLLVESMGKPVVGLVDFGTSGGQVLVLADVGMLDFAGLEPPETNNFIFLRNIARFALSR